MTHLSAKLFASLVQDDEPMAQQWASQQQAEWCKEAANRAALIESLIIRHDWQACHRWLNQWQQEDSGEREAGEASAKTLAGSGADLLPPKQNHND